MLQCQRKVKSSQETMTANRITTAVLKGTSLYNVLDILQVKFDVKRLMSHFDDTLQFHGVQLVYVFVSPSDFLCTDVVAYVDVWSTSRSENYSDTFIQQLRDMGAQVRGLA